MTQREKILSYLGALISLFLFSLNQTIIAAALPTIVSELDGFHLYAWAYVSFSLLSTVFILIWGSLSDIFGRKLIFLLGILIFSVATVLTGFSQSMAQFILYRGLQGIGGGALGSFGARRIMRQARMQAQYSEP